MFKNTKQAIENWLKNTIAEEVVKLDTSLRREKAEFHAHLLVFDAQLVLFNKAVANLIEANHNQENTALREHIKQLHAGVAEVSSTLKKLHPIT